MTNQHPITPPPELVQQWADMLSHRSDHAVFSLAARWGSDQELEACCMWLSREVSNSGWELRNQLRIARRPKPPSLKEQALEALGADGYSMLAGKKFEPVQLKIIRRALEALPND